MMRKVLLAAFLAAFVVAGGGAFGADHFFVGGGGGGGGGAGKSDADGGGGGGGGGGSASDTGTNLAGKGGDGGEGGNTGGTEGAGGATAGSGGKDGVDGVGGGTGGFATGLGGAAGDNTNGPAGVKGDDAINNATGGSNGANGGMGGSAADSFDLSTYDTGETITFLGGDGGAGGAGVVAAAYAAVGKGGGGGAGGNVNVTLTGTGVVDAAVAITGGAAAVGGASGLNDASGVVVNAEGGKGGNGGNVAIIATAATLTLKDTMTLQGGAGAASDEATGKVGGNGGNVSFTGGTVILDGGTIAVKNVAAATEADADRTQSASGNVDFKVAKLAAGAGGGTFSTAAGAAKGNGVGIRTIEIGAIEAIDGNMNLDFTTLADVEAAKMKIGAVTLGKAGAKAMRTLTVTNDAGGAFTAAKGWKGSEITLGDGTKKTVHLQTQNIATLVGVDLGGAAVYSDITGITGLVLADDAIITLGAGSVVAADTDVTVKANATQLADIQANGDLIVFDGDVGGGTDGDVAELEGEKLTVMVGASKYEGVFAAVGEFDAAIGLSEQLPLVDVTDVTDTGAAYNAMLAAPAVMSLVNGGADVVEKAAGSFSPMAFVNGAAGGMQFGVFADIGAASIDVDTGSGVDTDSFHMIIGPGLRISNGTGKTDFGAFFEAGWGSYDAFSGVYHGEGDTEYYGGGLLLRHDTCFGLYGEASVRLGGADSEYNNLDDLDTDYDINASYFGGHLGLGYILRPTECSSWDFFAKGILTRVSSEEAKDTSGSLIELDSTTSFRTQMGAKYSYNFAQNASFYVKGAWEHEFDGETGGRYNGRRIAKNADTGGSSVIGELGVDVRLAERVSLGASIYGITGTRDGFGGNLNIGIGF